MDYEKDLGIDHNALDVECVEQPLKFYRYSKLAADASLELDRAKERLSVVDAEIDAEIRKSAKEDERKITENQVSAEILKDKRHKEAYDSYLKKKSDLDYLNAAVRAFSQRKDSIENLIKLMTMDYFAKPREPRNLDKEMKGRSNNTGDEEATRSRIRRRGRED